MTDMTNNYEVFGRVEVVRRWLRDRDQETRAGSRFCGIGFVPFANPHTRYPISTIAPLHCAIDDQNAATLGSFPVLGKHLQPSAESACQAYQHPSGSPDQKTRTGVRDYGVGAPTPRRRNVGQKDGDAGSFTQDGVELNHGP